jgi:hypothetical protein
MEYFLYDSWVTVLIFLTYPKMDPKTKTHLQIPHFVVLQFFLVMVGLMWDRGWGVGLVIITKLSTHIGPRVRGHYDLSRP